ncbi:MAG: phytoene/squalene synthase family protein [Candidatus Euphemobacter frigidus]|nr:phytoene/squalene synthase family protein [Candidatus Euphemobacter frigidus]MDP8276089.1 phytoene/squalene synthase family protein [Candidatus Euphemobacter frigidus]
MMKRDSLIYCHQVLPEVSRTFALGIDLLRAPLRDSICVAYLICRILDTIEDTTDLPASDRAILLEQAGRELLDVKQWDGYCDTIRETFSDGRFSGKDQDLCRHCIDVLKVFHAFPDPVRQAITGPVREMAEGMARTVRKELKDGELRLETIEDLEKYCYYVAGTVGILLTNLFSLDRASITADVQSRLSRYGVRFGQGLQLTNIIKGVTDDNIRGVIYLPRQLLREAGVTLQDLLDHPDDPRGKRLIAHLVSVALTWLDDALEYTVSIPTEEEDIRLFCALPLVFAVRTLGLSLCTSHVFDRKPLKITRSEVSAIYLRLKAIRGDDDALREIYRKEKAKVIEYTQ